MPRYDLWESIDGEEVTLTCVDDPNKHPMDTEGHPMRRVKTFLAADWDAAKQVRNDHYGWGPYIPWP